MADNAFSRTNISPMASVINRTDPAGTWKEFRFSDYQIFGRDGERLGMCANPTVLLFKPVNASVGYNAKIKLTMGISGLTGWHTLAKFQNPASGGIFPIVVLAERNLRLETYKFLPQDQGCHDHGKPFEQQKDMHTDMFDRVDGAYFNVEDDHLWRNCTPRHPHPGETEI